MDGHRSLADQLRSWSDERLQFLLGARPDLATPAPHDFSQLASRAGVRNSIARALDGLTRGELSVLDALVVAGQTTSDELVSIVHADPDFTRAALERLADLALVWSSPEGLRPLSGVADCLTGPEGGASGLRPRSAQRRAVAEVARLVETLPRPARALLEHVVAEGSTAKTGATRLGVRPEDAETPAELLVAHRLLMPGGSLLPGLFVVPGEVGLALRGGRTTTERIDVPPRIASEERSERMATGAAVGAATEAVRRTETLLEWWGHRPAAALRTTGLGVRELRAAAAHLQLAETEVALLVEVAAEAGLLGSRADADGNPVWVPTSGFDTWRELPPAQQWSTLAGAWLRSTRVPSLVGSRGADGKTWNALSPELSAPGMPEAKAMVLDALASLPPGHGLASGTGLPSLVAHLTWLRPRRPRTRPDLLAWAVAEAAALGVSGVDVLAPYGRALAAGEDPVPVLAALLPPPVDHVLIQADLTAVAPGPLEPGLARQLHQVADVESHGAATVFRFTPDSVRRAFDAGWTAAELHAFLLASSRTPVPQPLSYLVDDVARSFGRLRVGVASAFIRSEDASALTELLGHPRAAGLGLQLLAPTVLVATVPIDVLLPRLRDLGLAPVLEGPDGVVRVGAAEPLRARAPRTRDSADPARAAARTAAQVVSAVHALREGDAEAQQRPASASAAGGGVLSALRDAIERRGDVLIGFTDHQGVLHERAVRPLVVEGGRLTAWDRDAAEDDPDARRSYAVHRISRVVPLGD
ncbi:helicase-associated domain-containing protein [Nocardioides sp. zg-536]|uniref:Helicase-associated domain-containing protein n=1 Tax=Nocardioides faecalis TaxID=2803858 RepID=A0A938Y1Q0_9ACTN|nr:helicase-associated domain-containing protein [Nocardioides faecalis]QVI60712.1 helicase-associated domain-containing protein [Nocardioides faecalis]